MIDLAITGAAGRMGTRLIALAKQDGGFNIVGAIEKPDHPNIARDAGEVAGVVGLAAALHALAFRRRRR